MANADQLLAQIASVLTGGYGSGFSSVPGSIGNETYNTVPDQGRIMGQRIEQALTPLLHLPAGVPYVPTGVGVNQALYSANVTARQWQEVQDAATKDTAAEMTHMSSQMLRTLTGKRIKDPAKAQAVLETVLPAVMNTAAFKTAVGGDIAGSYQQIFANRALFGQSPTMNPFDHTSREQESQAAIQLAHLMNSKMRDVNGLPNTAFTQGFKTDEITDLQMKVAQGGRWSPGMMSNPQGQQVVAAQTHQYAQLFRTLSELTGSGDMQSLQKAMDTLTTGSWTNANFNVEEFNKTLREMSATATLLGHSKSEMVQTVATMQQSLQGSLGIGAGDIAMGLAPNNLTQAAATIAARGYAAARAQNITDPAKIRAIQMQGGALAAIGINSEGGKLARVLEYQQQNGAFTAEQYTGISMGLRSENAAERSAAARQIAQSVGGPAMLAEKMSDNGLRFIDRQLTPSAMTAAYNTVGEGQRNQYRELVNQGAMHNRQAILGSLQGSAGLRFAGDPNKEAQAHFDAIQQHLRGLSGDMQASGAAAATVLQETWNANPNLTEAQRMNAVRARLSDPTMAAMAKNANLAGEQGADTYRQAALAQNALPATQFNTVMQSLRAAKTEANKGAIETAIDSAHKQFIAGDYTGALGSLNTFRTTSGVVSAASNTLIDAQLRRNAGAVGAQLLSAEAQSAVIARQTRGAATGARPDQVMEEQQRITAAIAARLHGTSASDSLIYFSPDSTVPKAEQESIQAALRSGNPADLEKLRVQQGAIMGGLQSATMHPQVTGAVPSGMDIAQKNSSIGIASLPGVAGQAVQLAQNDQMADDMGSALGAFDPIGQRLVKGGLLNPVDNVMAGGGMTKKEAAKQQKDAEAWTKQEAKVHKTEEAKRKMGPGSADGGVGDKLEITGTLKLQDGNGNDTGLVGLTGTGLRIGIGG